MFLAWHLPLMMFNLYDDNLLFRYLMTDKCENFTFLLLILLFPSSLPACYCCFFCTILIFLCTLQLNLYWKLLFRFIFSLSLSVCPWALDFTLHSLFHHLVLFVGRSKLMHLLRLISFRFFELVRLPLLLPHYLCHICTQCNTANAPIFFVNAPNIHMYGCVFSFNY